MRTTIRPDVEIEVGPAEWVDLKRAGLLADQQQPGMTWEQYQQWHNKGE